MRMQRKGNSYVFLVGMQIGMTIMENTEILSNFKKEVPHDPVIPLLGTYTKEIKSVSQRNTCTPMSIAALFAVANI